MKTFINNGNNNSYDIVHIPGTTSQYDVTAVDGKLVYTSKDGARQYTVDAAEGFRFKEDGSFRYAGNWKYKWADLFAPFLNLTGTTNIFSDGSEFATYQFNDSLLDLTNTYNASSVGTLTYEDGNYGTALNTTNGYANTGFKMSNYSAVSVSFWFKGTTTGNTYMLAENGGTSTGANASSAFHINTANGNIKIGLGNGSSTQWIEVTDAIYQDGQWRHLVVTLSGKDAKIYIDAVLKGTYTLTTTWGSYKSTSNVCIGNFGVYNNGSLNYPGLIDQMRFFDRVLSNDEVKMLNIENSVPAKASCAAWKAEGFNQSGAYNINFNSNTFKAYCDMTTDGGGWMAAIWTDAISATTFSEGAGFVNGGVGINPNIIDYPTTETLIVSNDYYRSKYTYAETTLNTGIVSTTVSDLSNISTSWVGTKLQFRITPTAAAGWQDSACADNASAGNPHQSTSGLYVYAMSYIGCTGQDGSMISLGQDDGNNNTYAGWLKFNNTQTTLNSTQTTYFIR